MVSGAQGASGCGSQGPQGLVGSQGSCCQGPQGVTGLGSQGAAGTQGLSGDQGATGPQGPANRGSQGALGTQGAVGVQGAQGGAGSGAQGNAGYQGSAGQQGAVGTQGYQGGAGAQGSTGANGVQGLDGIQGDTGVQGVSGAQGVAGIGVQGAAGVQGVSGVQGSTGLQGTDGLLGLQGDAGSQGVLGVQGLAGLQGAAGAQGLFGLQGIVGSQGSAGSQGLQGVQGPRHLYVEHTAYVDNIFASATPAVQDMANPFATINAALAAIAAFRGADTTTRWNVEVRPGTFNEGSITTLPNVHINGSGRGTIVNSNFLNPLGAGPATLSNMVVNVPSNSIVLVEDTLILENSEWYFTPTLAGRGACFSVQGSGTPVLRMWRTFLSEVPSSPSTIGTGFVQVENTTSALVTIDMVEVTGVQLGIAAGVVGFSEIAGTIRMSCRNSTFDLTIYDSGRANILNFVWGGNGVLGRTDVPNATFDLVWEIDDVSHTLRNAYGPGGPSPISPFYIAVLSGFTLNRSPDSLFVFRDCRFQYVNYPTAAASGAPPANVYSSTVSIGAPNLLQFLDDKWIGLSLATASGTPASTSYVPQPSAASEAVVYEGVSSLGSVVWSGGMQTGSNALSGAVTAYNAVDADTFINWATAAPSTLTLPTPTPNGVVVPYNVFNGKWLVVYNSGTSAITVTAVAGPAVGMVIAAGSSVTFIGATNGAAFVWVPVAAYP